MLREVRLRARALNVVGMNQLKKRHARSLRLRPPEYRHPCRVGCLEVALRIDGPQQVWAELPNQALAHRLRRSAGAQRLVH